MMYYALTINKDNIITGVHESVTPILADAFATNPELAEDMVVSIPSPADYQTYTHILCYEEDGTLKDLVWCIENGYMELPPNMEIIDGELVDKEIPAEEQPQTLKQYLEEQFGSVLRESEKKVSAIKPLMTELVKDKPADIVIQSKEFIMPWAAGKYALDDVRMWEEQPKRCCQAHDSTDNPTWTPAVASLWSPYHGTTKSTALPWIAPTGAHDVYKALEYMIWTDGKICRSKRTTNFSPEDYPADWEYLNENGEYVDFGSAPIEPEEPNPDPEEPTPEEPTPEEPTPEPVELNKNGTVKWGEWVDPAGNNSKLYMKDDGITFDGVKRVSVYDKNGNPPSVVGWWTDYVV